MRRRWPTRPPARVELGGIATRIVPFDMGVPAEALGATLNTYAHSEDILYPTLRDKFVNEADDLKMPTDMASAGRVPGRDGGHPHAQEEVR